MNLLTTIASRQFRGMSIMNLPISFADRRYLRSQAAQRKK
jgi:hypothetical protein